MEWGIGGDFLFCGASMFWGIVMKRWAGKCGPVCDEWRLNQKCHDTVAESFSGRFKTKNKSFVFENKSFILETETFVFENKTFIYRF